MHFINPTPPRTTNSIITNTVVCYWNEIDQQAEEEEAEEEEEASQA